MAVSVAGICLQAQTPPAMTVARLYDSQLKNTEGEVVSLAEAMPESKFGFRPTGGAFQDVRTFAEQRKHIAAVNYLVSAAVLGEKVPVDTGKGESGPEDLKSKEAVVKFLKGSYAYAHKAWLSLTAENPLDMIQTPFGAQKSARAGMANLTIWHSFDHYGQIVVYARMNGVVPPASR
jgi:uncharacterized damage-inducible protein DinB